MTKEVKKGTETSVEEETLVPSGGNNRKLFLSVKNNTVKHPLLILSKKTDCDTMPPP